MINWESILSAFDEKGTLMKWLKKVEAALKGSVLTNVEPIQNDTRLELKFNFEDGTSITSPAITLPRGEAGPQGPTGEQGPKGETGTSGNGIVSIHSVSHSTVGDEEVTKVEVVTDDNTQEFEVHAKNGLNNLKPFLFEIYLESGGDVSAATHKANGDIQVIRIENGIQYTFYGDTALTFNFPHSGNVSITGYTAFGAGNIIFADEKGAPKILDTYVHRHEISMVAGTSLNAYINNISLSSMVLALNVGP